jgi:very-short-patch-repair endonuclease
MIINSKKDGSKYVRSSLESRFEQIWLKAFPTLNLVVESSVIPGRRFRVDYIHLESKVTIEIQGGQFMAVGGHSTGAGKMKDAEKNNLLILNGFKPFVLWTSQVTIANVKPIGDFIIGSYRQ